MLSRIANAVAHTDHTISITGPTARKPRSTYPASSPAVVCSPRRVIRRGLCGRCGSCRRGLASRGRRSWISPLMASARTLSRRRKRESPTLRSPRPDPIRPSGNRVCHRSRRAIADPSFLANAAPVPRRERAGNGISDNTAEPVGKIPHGGAHASNACSLGCHRGCHDLAHAAIKFGAADATTVSASAYGCRSPHQAYGRYLLCNGEIWTENICVLFWIRWAGQSEISGLFR